MPSENPIQRTKLLARISNTESAIKVDGATGSVRVMLDIAKSDEDLVALFISLIGQEFEIKIDGHDKTSEQRIRYYG